MGVSFVVVSCLAGNDVLARQTTPAQGQFDHDGDQAKREGGENHDDQADKRV